MRVMNKLVLGAIMLVGACAEVDEADDVGLDETAQEAITPCTISITGPASTTLGQDLNFTATASCPVGTPAIRWFQKINNQFQLVGPESTSTTFTFNTSTSPVGPNVFKADVKQQGTTQTQLSSNLLTVQINDNVPSCTNIVLLAPTNNAQATVGQAVTLRASANCGAGTPEFQFWVKKPNVANWTFLPGPYVANGANGSFIPGVGDIGSLNVKAAARSVGAHVQYSGLSNSVTINVQGAPNQPPTATNDTISTTVGVAGSTNLADNISDFENDPLTLSIDTQGANGTASLSGTTVTYTPNPGFAGTDSFIYKVTDTSNGSATATVNVTVANTDPTATNASITTSSNATGSVDVASNIADADSDPLTVSVSAQPTFGSASVTGTVVSYTPNANFVGSDSFTYQVADTHGGTATATVSVTVTNQGPTANPDSITTSQGQVGSVDVATNDSEPEVQALTIASFTQGVNGSVSFSGTTASYTPNVGFTGTDSFNYTIQDSFGAQSSSVVNVTVNSGTPGCTVSLSAPATGVFGTPLTLTATASCNTGAAEVQFLHKINNGFEIVRGFGTTATASYTPNSVGQNFFKVQVRTQGTTSVQAESAPLTLVNVADNNTSFCSNARVTVPTANSTLSIGVPATLSATASCTNGGSPEFQFWVKPTTTANWTILPGFTIGSSTFTPVPPAGTWNIKVVVRSANDSHAAYQSQSPAIVVNVQ